jgi:ABC-type multidrug transport system fused ATPase/permease subunit
MDELGAGGERQRRAGGAGVLAAGTQLQLFQRLRQPLFSRNQHGCGACRVCLFTPVVDVLGALATALVVYIGGTAVLGESITAGVLIAFVLYIDRFFEPIRD